MKVKIVNADIRKSGNKIRIGGYKHSFVVVVCAALMCNINVEISNVPEIKEKTVFIKILEILGKNISFSKNKLILFQSQVRKIKVPDNITNLVHGSMYFLPVLLNLNHEVQIFESGGCRIGDALNKSTRPIQHVLKVMKEFGAEIKDDYMFLEKYHGIHIDIMEYSTATNELRGPYVSGATKTAILCALGANERTVIKNPYLKADVIELLQFAEQIGYVICKLPRKIIIDKKSNVRKDVLKYSLGSDVTEIITFISYAVYYNVEMLMENITVEFVKESLKKEFEYLQKMGIKIRFGNNTMRVYSHEDIKEVNIDVTGESIYSDSQPFFALMLLRAKKESVIIEYVWKSRYEYAKEMQYAGANIRILDNKLIINQTLTEFGPVTLKSKDLRGAAVLTLFVLEREGSVIEGIEHIDRGYEFFWDKLRSLGIETYTYE